ncbi:hypothetical protein ACFQ1I_41805 [Kitasatospora arboriphila]
MPAYEELGEAERRLWEAFPRGEELDLRGAADTAVRAEVVAALLLGGGLATVRGRVGGLRLVGATVTGQLDLTGAAVELPVQVRDCTFEQRVLLRGATVRSTSFLKCQLPGLDGWLLRVDGNLFFEDSVIEGRLTLTRAHITGELRLSGVRLTASELLEPRAPRSGRHRPGRSGPAGWSWRAAASPGRASVPAAGCAWSARPSAAGCSWRARRSTTPAARPSPGTTSPPPP